MSKLKKKLYSSKGQMLALLSIAYIPEDAMDKKVWMGTTNGYFSCQSLFAAILSHSSNPYPIHLSSF